VTRVRVRNFLRVPNGEYELVNYTDGAEWVVRDEGGDVLVFEQSGPLETVELQCDYCGRWTPDAMRDLDGGTWQCFECPDQGRSG
jgi:hypothetical protein